MGKKGTNKGINKWLLSITVFVLVTVVCWAGITVIGQYTSQESMEKAQDAATKYSLRLEVVARDMVTDTSRMADVARQQRTNDGWFMSAAQSVVKQNGKIIGIQYSPAGRAPIAYPNGFSFGADSGLAPAFAKLQDTAISGDGTPLVMSPVKLQSGTEGVLAMSPVFAYNNRTQHFDYLGNVALVMKLPEAIEDDALKEIQAAGYLYSVYGNNSSLEKDGVIIHSEGEVPDNAAAASARVPGGHWMVKLAPTDSWSQTGQSMGLIASLIAGAVLGGLTLWGLTIRQQRAENRRLLMTDQLTQSGNKRALKEALAGMCHQLKAHFVVACMDIQNLKRVNKAYGMDTGDRILKEVANRIQDCLKEDDKLFRLGEDSFVAIIDNESLEGVSRRLNEIKEKVARVINVDGIPINVALDVGGSAFPMDSRQPNELVKIADQRMNVKKGIVVPEGTDWLADGPESANEPETNRTVENSGEE